MNTVEFTFKGIIFVVKVLANGHICYRDKAHFGGKWALAELSIANPSLHPTFRRKLRECRSILVDNLQKQFRELISQHSTGSIILK